VDEFLSYAGGLIKMILVLIGFVLHSYNRYKKN